MKKKYWKLIALFIALGLIFSLLSFANSLVGNPLSEALAERSVQRYLAEHYPNTDFYVDRMVFSFKDSSYHAFILSPTSVDTDFSLTIDLWGRVYWDTYEDVLGGFVTAQRLDQEYRALTDQVFLRSTFPYECQIAFGTLEIHPREAMENPDVTDIPDYALVQEELVIDGIYDTHALGAQAGHLIVYIDLQGFSPEIAAQILLTVRSEFDSAGIPFRAIDLTLQYPLPEEGPRPDDHLSVADFPYGQIVPEGLEQRVEEAHRALEAYYAAQGK